MAKPIRTVIKADLSKEAYEQPCFHNRWHPEVESVASVEPGEVVNIECVDWTGGQIGNNDSADDIRDVDLTRVHYLSGPLHVASAEPGDVLVVEIVEIQPLPEQPWGFTGVFDKKNGGGFLDEHYPAAAKAIWDFEGVYASSRHVPGVRFPGMIHPGLMGCAPSHELLNTWTTRETQLVQEKADTVGKPVAELPQAKGAHAGAVAVDGRQPELASKIHREGARTVPPREHGGNVDCKNVGRGSKSYMPVYVHGAKFSIGDLHFSQGDGEISFCGAIEMAGVITIKFDVIKAGVANMAMRNPFFFPGPVQPQFSPSRFLTFEGISVDEKGKQHFLDTTVAYRQSCLNCIEYFKRFGYSGYQLYLLLSAAPVEGHIAGVVDVPNAATTLGMPIDIFDFDVSPAAGKPAARAIRDCPVSRPL